MAEVRVNGVRINYRRLGAGPDLVLVHGLGANQAFWDLETLGAFTRHFRVTTFDLRGHGYSELAPSGYRPCNLARDLAGLLDHLGVRRTHLVGHSFGGLVALQFALQAPERAASLTVADSRLRGLQPRQPLTEEPDWPRLRRVLGQHGIPVADDEPELGVLLLEALAHPDWDRARQRFAERHRFVPFGAGPRSARRWLRLLGSTTAKQDFREGSDFPEAALGRLGCPALAFYGETSPNRPTGEALAAVLPRCRLAISAGVGHFHPVTRPSSFRRVILEFRGHGPIDRVGRVRPVAAAADPVAR